MPYRRSTISSAALAEESHREPAGESDTLQLFLAGIGRHRLLTAAEEVVLAKRIERGDSVAKRR